MSLFERIPMSTTRQAPSMMAKCGACKLYLGCRSPKMPVWGHGKKKIMVIGEAPGEREDELGRPFIGLAGQKLRAALKMSHIDLDEDCWVTNSLICRPPSNATPTDQQIDYCRPNAIKALLDYEPVVVILAGTSPIKSVIPYLWKNDNDGMNVGRWVGYKIPCQKINAWVCPVHHPSYINRVESMPNGQVTLRNFNTHIANAVSLTFSRPWINLPKYKDEVDIELSPTKAAKRIQEYIDERPISFDYETNMLKPYSDESAIVCCAVSDGKRCISYPWTGEAIDATKKLLESKTPKYGWNIQFESQWSWKYGINVRNWKWDGMIATHVLDNRPRICGFKFQSFVRLGMRDYDSHIKNYLSGEGSYGANRIRELDLHSLLLYCGLDAHLEHLVCELQRDEMK